MSKGADSFMWLRESAVGDYWWLAKAMRARRAANFHDLRRDGASYAEQAAPKTSARTAPMLKIHLPNRERNQALQASDAVSGLPHCPSNARFWTRTSVSARLGSRRRPSRGHPMGRGRCP